MLQLLGFFGAKIIVYSITGAFYACIMHGGRTMHVPCMEGQTMHASCMEGGKEAHTCNMHERENHARSMHGIRWNMHVSCTEFPAGQPYLPNNSFLTTEQKPCLWSWDKKAQQKEQQESTRAIILEDCDLPSEECEKWVNGLTKKERAIISTNGWLTDNIVNAAQGLLKQQYPHINGFWSKRSARPHFILCCQNGRVHSSSPHWAWLLGNSVNGWVQRRTNSHFRQLSPCSYITLDEPDSCPACHS